MAERASCASRGTMAARESPAKKGLRRGLSSGNVTHVSLLAAASAFSASEGSCTSATTALIPCTSNQDFQSVSLSCRVLTLPSCKEDLQKKELPGIAGTLQVQIRRAEPQEESKQKKKNRMIREYVESRSVAAQAM